jgi:hypothetical protein
MLNRVRGAQVGPPPFLGIVEETSWLDSCMEGDRRRNDPGDGWVRRVSVLKNIIVLVTAAAALTGCIGFPERSWSREDVSWSEPASPPADSYWTSNVEITNGQLAGSMGAYHGFSEVAYRQAGYSDSYYADVTLDAGRDFWVMTRLSIEGGLAHPALVPGASFEFDGYGYSTEGGVYISALGCSGPSEGNFEFDESAQHLTVQVEAGPTASQRVIRFNATFSDGATVVGSFGYTVPEPGAPEPYEPWGADLGVQDGYMAGDMGTIVAFSADAYAHEAYDYGDVSTVRLDAGTDYWVMAQLDIEGGLHHPDLVPGARLSFRGYEDVTEGGVFISALGCSGPSYGSFDFDGSAEELDVQITQGSVPGQWVMSFWARFSTGQTTQGSFGYTAPY